MQNENFKPACDETAGIITDGNEALQNGGLSGAAGDTEKKSVLSRLRSFFNRKDKQPSDKIKTKPVKRKLSSDVSSEDVRKINEFLGSIENQLDKVDEQNKSLLEQLSLLKTNNEILVSQVEILTRNNISLTEQFNAMKKREKIAKILAIISAVLAIGLSAYNILRLIIGW